MYETDESSLLNKLKLYSWLTEKIVITSRTILQLPSPSTQGSRGKGYHILLCYSS